MNVPIAIFPEKICCNVSYENLYLNVGIMVASGLWSFVYFINFQIRQIPATNHFSLEKIILFLLSILLCGHDFWKKNINVSGLKSLCEIMVSKYGHLMLPGRIRHRLKTFLFCRKVMSRSQDIHVLVFLTILLPDLWRHD